MFPIYQETAKYLNIKYQSILNFGSTKPVPSNVNDVVHSSGDLPVATVVSVSSVAGEVVPRVHGEVGFNKALVVPKNCPGHARPRSGNAKGSIGIRTFNDIALWKINRPIIKILIFWFYKLFLHTFSSISDGLIPNMGRIGFPATISAFSSLGLGVMQIPPVSVCHQVSTTSHFSSPTTLWYHSQASWLIGSPTEPRDLKEDLWKKFGHWSRLLSSRFKTAVFHLSCFLTHSSSYLRSNLMAVGAP